MLTSFPRLAFSALVLTVLLGSASHVSGAMLSTPKIALQESGWSKQRVTVSAGSTGAPAGFTVLWMREADFLAAGGAWTPAAASVGSCHFWGAPSIHVFPGESPTFQLSPGAEITVEIGSLYDESGLTTSSPGDLQDATTYVYAVFANASDGMEQSPLSVTLRNPTRPLADCTYTQGYWKNHPEVWPIASITLGTVTYTQAEALAILDEPVAGNGLISLAHQLIATKLNLAMGADPTDLGSTVADADALIGGLVVPPVGSGYLAPSSTSALTQTLDDFNSGVIGPGHCPPSATQPMTWGAQKAMFR